MADTIELFLIGQALLLVTFLAMVGLFLLLLFVRTHAGSGDGMINDEVFDDVIVVERREVRGWFSGGGRQSSAPVSSHGNDARHRRGWFGAM